MSSPSKVEPAGLDREALERERSRLEGLLALDEAWRALKQLEERLARGEATSAIGADALKESLERELASNRLYSVYRDVVAKLAAPAVSSARAAAETSPCGTKVTTVPTGAPTRTAERFVEPASEDDLTRIRGLTRPIAERLKSLGISRFETIANWTRADVDRISIALGLGRAIVRQSWVDQAAILVQNRSPRAPASAAAPKAAGARVVAPDVTPPTPRSMVAAVDPPLLPQPPAPPPQAVLGTLLHRRPDQPVNEPLLSLQRPRAGLVPGPAAAADPTATVKPGPLAAAGGAPSKPPAEAVDTAESKLLAAPTQAGPISAAALAAAIAARSVAASSPAGQAVPVAAAMAPPASQAASETPIAPDACAKPATPVAVPPAAVAPAAKPSPYDDRIELIDGLGADAIVALAKAGVTKTAQVAVFKAENVKRWRHDLGAGLRVPFAHVIEQAAMLAAGQLPAAARRMVEGRGASLVPRPASADWGPPVLLDQLRREAEEAARLRTPDETDRIARRSLREALAGGDPVRATFASTMTTARTRLVDRLALIDLPRKPRGSGDDVVAAFEERMAALQRDLDEMERRLRAEPAPGAAADAGSASPTVEARKPDTSKPDAAADTNGAVAAAGGGIPAALATPTASQASDGTATTPAATSISTSAPTPLTPQPAAGQAVRNDQPIAAAAVVASSAPEDAAATATSPVPIAAIATALPTAIRIPPVEPAPKQVAAKPAAAELAGAGDSVARVSASRTSDPAPKDGEPESLLGLGEADVVIVAKAPPPRPVETPAAVTGSPPVVSAESLARRLRRFGSAEPIEADGYAAYHGEVEEAAVEIVRGPRPAALAKSPANGAAAPKSAAGERNSAIKRFVRALSGGP